ncbi:glycosyltransferase [Nibribacter koreensis]|uniref:Glycosyltransferase subfamily 4-like N-terminal domain-containing protein n=1 Tax=Nibribacter koreensis TaxID=1084519 RepID=A0ABP8FJI0_9BACT
MKVLFVCSGNSKNFEVVPFIKEQGDSLVRRGIEVDYYPIVGKGLAGYLKAGLQLRKHLQTKQYDLIHAHFTLSGWSAVLGARKTPVILSLMGSDAYGEYIGVNKIKFSSRYFTLLTYLIQPFTKVLISKSANIEKYVFMKDKSYIVPNGINKEKFKPSTEDHRTELGLPLDKKLVLFLGNKTNIRKNYPLAKQAVDSLNRPDVELINPFPVTHDQIPKYLNAVDVLVVPSLMEGSPNVIKEAMACNCPIVSTDMGDAKWVLGDTPGCYATSFDPADFAQKLKLSLDFAEKHGRTNGAQRIKNLGLDADTVANRIVDIYKVAVNQTDKPVTPAPFAPLEVQHVGIT